MKVAPHCTEKLPPGFTCACYPWVWTVVTCGQVPRIVYLMPIINNYGQPRSIATFHWTRLSILPGVDSIILKHLWLALFDMIVNKNLIVINGLHSSSCWYMFVNLNSIQYTRISLCHTIYSIIVVFCIYIVNSIILNTSHIFYDKVLLTLNKCC